MRHVYSEHPHRREVYLCNLKNQDGSVQRGYRPVMVISNERINTSSPNVIVASITSSLKKEDLSFHVNLPSVSWLPKKSMVMLEQLQTIPRSELGRFCGRITDSETKKKINDGLIKVFDLKRNPPTDGKDVICLCSKCVSFYRSHKNYLVIRITPEDGDRDFCNKCGKSGAMDYVVSEINYFDDKSRREVRYE